MTQDINPLGPNDNELTGAKQLLIFVWELFKVVVISLAIIVPVRAFIIKPFYVKGASMEPNFHNGEYLIIDELSYNLGDPKRGDAVVFKYPEDTTRFFIKRVLALPGERVVISNDHITLYNKENPQGVIVVENYLNSDIKTSGNHDLTLKDEEYYLLGDNRTASLDSRSFGPVDRHFIIGKTLLRGWPIKDFGLVINKIDYNLN